jgi:hypothetical protein
MNGYTTKDVYVTKYCLASGEIELWKGARVGDSGTAEPVDSHGKVNYWRSVPAQFVFDTLEEAKIHAETLRQKKLKSLQKQLDRHTALTF